MTTVKWPVNTWREIRSRLGPRSQAVGESLAVGLAIAFADIHFTGYGIWISPAYLLAGVALGVRHAGQALFCWLPLGVSLYVVHVVTIALGGKQPYVEANARLAEACLDFLTPTGLGLLVGSFSRVSLAAFGWFQRPGGPPIRFLPVTTREALTAIAVIGLAFGILHRAAAPPTLYAAGYSEARFQSIREGMTADQVLAILGPPIRKRPQPDEGETWLYSEQYHSLSDFDRRWLYLKDGVVTGIVSDYWID
jgi:hypothetical protein